MLNRRNFMYANAVAAMGLAHPLTWAQSGAPIKIGVLIPLTGATSQYGASMAKAARQAAAEINAVGGVNGRKVEVVIEDDQSNPEAAVRAARKLIDIDKVVSIGGLYASSVTAAVAPLCWEAKVIMSTASGADSITQMPHNGFIFRPSPTVTLQGSRIAEFGLELGCKRAFYMGPQTPFAQLFIDVVSGVFTKAGGFGSGVIYEDKKSNYRSEVDQALRAKADLIVVGGYVPDSTVLLKDLYRAGFTGKKIGLSYSINQKIADALPANVTEGAYSLVQSPAVNAGAYKKLLAATGAESLDTFYCQVYDYVTMVALALASAPKSEVNGVTVRDNIRKVTHALDGHQVVDNPTDGIKALTAGNRVNYDGASGALEFAQNGDAQRIVFRYEQIKNGKITVAKIA